MFITATEAKVQDDRQAQAEWSGRRVQGQDRQGSKTKRVRKKRGWEKTGADRTNAKLFKQEELATDKPENTGISTWDNGEDGRHLEGGGDQHKDR
jgi:hypothetical protein